MKFSIVSAFTNNAAQAQNLQSVNNLAVPDGVQIKHTVFIDGEMFKEAAMEVINQYPPTTPGISREVIALPTNTGGRDEEGRPGYLCHLINAASSFLTDADWISFLDEDNFLTQDHVATIAESIRKSPGATWGFTLRRVVDDDGNEMDDTVESMGNIRNTSISWNDFLIDTNCFIFSKEIARMVAPLWPRKARVPGEMEADRLITRALLKDMPHCFQNRHHTVMYRLGNRSDSVQMSFFEKSVQKMPVWDPAKKDVYVFFFDNQQTERVLNVTVQKSPLEEWCMTMLDDFHSHGFNLCNGFNSLISNTLPTDALCFLVMCRPDTLPFEKLASLKRTTHTGMKRVLYTAESPNLRHRQQWTEEFLVQYADHVLTYADFILENPHIQSTYVPHNARFFREIDAKYFSIENEGKNTGSVCMILEARNNRGSYSIDSTKFECLDYLRLDAAHGFGEQLTVVGHGWKDIIQQMKEDGCQELPTLGYDLGHRSCDDKSCIETYKKHDFALIFENTNAAGYISEKIQDALIAGAIPLYFGSNLSQYDSTLRKGKGLWWIDVRGMIEWADKKPALRDQALGAKIRAFLKENFFCDPAMIALMKKRVEDVRKKYALERGSSRLAQAFASVV